MEPFSITCTTCQAKLKVRSAAAIGQILSCPKCDSMVQVLAPPGYRADTPAAAVIVPMPATVPSIAPASPTAAAQPADLSTTITAVSASFEDLAHLPVGGVSPTPPPVELPPLSAHWASPTETLWRKVALYGFVGGTALIVVGVAIGYLFSGNDAPPATLPVALAEVDPAPSETDASVPKDPNPSVPPPNEADISPSTAERPDTAQPAESLLPALQQKPPENSTVVAEADPSESDPAKLPAGDSPPLAAEVQPAPEQTARKNPTPENSAPDETTPAAPLDAAKLLADSSLETLLPGEAPSPDAALTVPVQEMTEAELTAAADAAESAENLTSADGSGGINDAGAPQAMVRRMPADSSSPLRPAEEILRLQLPQITFNNIPLALLLGELSDLSTLPVTYDLRALSAAQISPDVRVSVSASGKTLAEILATTLASKKLTYVTEGRHVIVTTPAAIAAARGVKFSVEDLAASEDQLRELAALMVKIVAPESWQFADGPGKIELEGNKLALEQSGTVIHESIVFCERLRAARGLTTRSRLPAGQVSLEVAQQRAKSHLARKVACTFHAPTRLTDVVRYLEEISGAKIYVDWQSLAKADIAPADRLTCALPEQPLSDALDSFLSPLGLDYRVLDGDTLEVFAQQDLPSKMTREFYSLGSLIASGITSEVLINGVRQLTGDGAWEPATSGFLHFDPASEHLIVRHGNKVHAQVQHLLDELTKKVASKKASSGKG